MVLSDIRKLARESLAGRWGKGVLIVLAYAIFEYLLGFISGLVSEIFILSLIVSIATIILSIPISFGLIASFIKLKRGEDVKVFNFITYGFNNFKRSWKLAGNILLKLWLPTLLYILATICLAFATTFGTMASAISSSVTFLIIATILGIALFIAAFVYLFVTSLSYSLTYLVAYDNEEMDAKDATEESKNLITGYRSKYVLLQLSFIGWAILTIFTLYIGMLWLVPYMQVAIVCFYETLKEKKAEQ